MVSNVKSITLSTTCARLCQAHTLNVPYAVEYVDAPAEVLREWKHAAVSSLGRANHIHHR